MSSFHDDRPERRAAAGPLLGIALALAGVSPSLVAAQTVQAAPPAPAASSASEPAGVAEPSPAHVEAARQLIVASGISRSFQIIIPELMDQIGGTVVQTRPELTTDLVTTLNGLRPEFDKQADEMINLSARIYAQLLSEQDVRTILAFFKSEAGNKYVNAQPLFLNELVAGIQAWQQKISVNMMMRVRQEMKKKGHDL